MALCFQEMVRNANQAQNAVHGNLLGVPSANAAARMTMVRVDYQSSHPFSTFHLLKIARFEKERKTSSEQQIELKK